MVNRILNSAASEVWRVTDEEGLDVEEVDKVIKESGTVPMGPFFLTDLLGLDTVSTWPSTCASPTATASTCHSR